MTADAASTRPASTAASDVTPDVRAALAPIARVARATVGAADIDDIANRTLDEIRDILGLHACVLYLDEGRSSGGLRRFATTSAPVAARDRLTFDEAAWRLVRATDGPIVFRESAGWLMENPFEPAASHWLVLPLVTGGGLLGVVVASSVGPISLDATHRIILGSLGDLLSAAVSTATLRRDLVRAELVRERLRLAADLHDGLAQDLALALREVAYLDRSPPEQEASASRARLREALMQAHRLVRAGLEDLAAAAPPGGLGPAASSACDRHRAWGLEVHLDLEGPVVTTDAGTVSVVLRVLHESLGNVLRHAQGSAAWVRLSVDGDRLSLTVDDAGPGLPVPLPTTGDGHFGIAIMRERARSAGGELELGSRTPTGTRLQLQLPVRAPRSVILA